MSLGQLDPGDMLCSSRTRSVTTSQRNATPTMTPNNESTLSSLSERGEMTNGDRISSTLSVTAVDVLVEAASTTTTTTRACGQANNKNVTTMSKDNSPSHSILTLTPGRTRNIDQDMEALRLSRQDNPYLQVNTSLSL